MKDYYVGDKLFTYVLLNINCKKIFICKSCAWKKIPMTSKCNVVKKIQKTFIQINVLFGRKIYLIVHVIALLRKHDPSRWPTWLACTS